MKCRVILSGKLVGLDYLLDWPIAGKMLSRNVNWNNNNK